MKDKSMIFFPVENPKIDHLNYKNINKSSNKYNVDCFIIWGNGLQFTDEIFGKINEYFEVITAERKRFDKIESLIKKIYIQEMKTIPHHIIAKNKHLLKCDPEAILILVKNFRYKATFNCNGHGPYNKKCTHFVEHFKQEIRDRYNPKQTSGFRTEDHVIHGTDNENQVVHALKAFGLKPVHNWVITDCLDWSMDDFNQNKKDSQLIRKNVEINIRKNNLETLSSVLNQFQIPFWLQGKTLLGLHRLQKFYYPDNDDDIATFLKHRIKISTHVYSVLKEMGFQVIRNDRWFLSLLRDNRYIDICFFENNGNKVGYGAKWFPRKHFKQLETIRFDDHTYPVPFQSSELLDKMYPQSVKVIEKKISYNDFINCKIEEDNSINWSLRGPHLNLITDNGRLRKIKDIINFFKDFSSVKKLKTDVLVETDTTEPFSDPINLNKKFWQTGNNYFFNCIYFGFKHDVTPYALVNNYISANNKYPVYSSEYYKHLKSMNLSQIKIFLENNPVVLENGCITHGQHRVCAMIGLLAAGNEYIPLYLN